MCVTTRSEAKNSLKNNANNSPTKAGHRIYHLTKGMVKITICPNCKKEFKGKSGQKFCSLKCSTSFYNYIKDPDFTSNPVLLDEFLPYLTGLILGDGCLTTIPNKNRERIILCLNDKDMMGKLKEIICPHRKMSVRYPVKPTHSKSYYFQTINENVINYFKQYGLVRRKSTILEYPEQFKDINNAKLRHFIRGYFDANGSIYYNNVNGHKYKHVKISIGSEQFANDLLKVLIKVGFDATIIKENRHTCFYICIYKMQHIEKLKSYFYDNTEWFLQRKRDIFYEDIV